MAPVPAQVVVGSKNDGYKVCTNGNFTWEMVLSNVFVSMKSLNMHLTRWSSSWVNPHSSEISHNPK